MTDLPFILYKNFKTRLKNPIITSFIISWVIFNWKPLSFFIYSNKEVENKIFYISQSFSDINQTFFFPLYVALFYYLALPFIMSGFDWVTSFPWNWRTNFRQEKEIIEIQNDRDKEIEKSGLKDQEEFNKEIELLNNDIGILKKQLFEEKENSQKEKEISLEEISQLKLALNEIEKEKNIVHSFNDDLASQVQSLTEKLQKCEEKKITENTEAKSVGFYIEKLERNEKLNQFLDRAIIIEKEEPWINKVNDSDDLNLFFRLGLIEVKNSSEDSILYSLTSIGRDVYNEIRLR